MITNLLAMCQRSLKFFFFYKSEYVCINILILTLIKNNNQSQNHNFYRK